MSDETTLLLRKLLDERGMEYEAYRDIKNRCITKWRTYHGAFVFFAVEKEGKLFVETASDTEHSAICTPEQAIAATLGSDDEYEAKMDALLCRLTNGKWSKSRAYDLDFMEQCINEEFEMLYAEDLADAELGNCTLTAEQVEKAIHDCSTYANYDGCTYYASGIRLQAIADELNAELGSGTCKITATSTNNLMYPDYMTKWYELSCGHSLTLKGDEAPKWCAVCGKAVDE